MAEKTYRSETSVFSRRVAKAAAQVIALVGNDLGNKPVPFFPGSMVAKTLLVNSLFEYVFDRHGLLIG